jgi:MoxR-like ATPase
MNDLSTSISDPSPGLRLASEVLAPMKRRFVGKDEVIDLLGVCLVAGENLFILGPPGTAKSALVHDLSKRFDGKVFDYLLTRFTEPNELFGPFDIRKLREGDLVTNTEGMLPEASFVFLDELLNANSAILNSLLLVLNQRVFRRGRETFKLPLLMVVGASNRLPEDESLGALFDRFLMRVMCDNVEFERLRQVIEAGWRIDQELDSMGKSLSVEDVQRLHHMVRDADFSLVRGPYVELIHRIRHAGIAVSDRRAVKLQRLLAASAILCGRTKILVSDMWVLRYIWDTREQQEVLAEIVRHAIDSSEVDESDERQHPRVLAEDKPDPDALALELDDIVARLSQEGKKSAQISYLQDRVSLIASRIQWIEDDQQRQFLEQKVTTLWESFGPKS